jgi:CheY-like chemotaxis protein
MAGELILIVEDNENNRMLFRDVLQSRGYQTAETDTGEEGVRLARASRPALILMDIQLPGMNGMDALKLLRADATTRDIPVMAVTSSAMTHDRQKIMASGFDAYQSKPINVREFVDAVRGVLAARGSSPPPPP